jgi:hypothetical protein
MAAVILAHEGRRCRARDNLAMAARGGASNSSLRRRRCLPVAMAMKDTERGSLVLWIWTEGGHARRGSPHVDLVGGRRERKRFTKRERRI